MSQNEPSKSFSYFGETPRSGSSYVEKAGGFALNFAMDPATPRP